MLSRLSLFPPERKFLLLPVSARLSLNVARVLSVSSGPSLCGGGDILSRRLVSLRADIVARGETSYRVYVRGRMIRCASFREVIVAFAVARAARVGSVDVWEIKTLGGVHVVKSMVTWLLLDGTFPCPVPSKQKKRSVLSRAERVKSRFVQ